ncbi:hypothetical protein STABA_v1c03760 [Spiroplasma tabanidicola]|uniref:Uncharacterized protein n=2 Tax=Spiroplasma tabanidicola TaxID=324079 RepID=A0A6I6C8G7_9MOLU|nr:hypothetical protein STABA_v1c03760 [Spiroplasma tabanidicola]
MFIRFDEWESFKKDLQLVVAQLESKNDYEVQRYISKNWKNLPICIDVELKKGLIDDKRLGGRNIVVCFDCKKEILALNDETKDEMFYLKIYEEFAKLINLDFKSIIHISQKCKACNEWICGSDFCDCKCFFEENDCEWIIKL